MIQSTDGTYDYIIATVDSDGIALEYQCSGLSAVGTDFIDDPGALGWTEGEVRKVVASYLDVTGGASHIEILY